MFTHKHLTFIKLRYKTCFEIQSKVKGIGLKKQSILSEVVSINKMRKLRKLNNVQDSCKVKHCRNISEGMKRSIAGKQHYKCINNPLVQLKRLENYRCPLWEKHNDNKGFFDQSGFEIDHVNEFSISCDNTEGNLQALCKSCHSVKQGIL